MSKIRIVMINLSVVSFAKLFAALVDHYPEGNVNISSNLGKETFLLELPQQDFGPKDREFFATLTTNEVINSWAYVSWES